MYSYNYVWLHLDNYIDGAALAALPYDIDEFKMLVPQCGIRMKIKMIITKHWDMVMNKVQCSTQLKHSNIAYSNNIIVNDFLIV